MLTRSRLREKVQPFVRRFRGIAQEHRVSIIYLLMQQTMSAGEIADHLGKPENLVSHHLSQLHASGWVIREKRGREIIYSMNKKAQETILRFFEGTSESLE